MDLGKLLDDDFLSILNRKRFGTAISMKPVIPLNLLGYVKNMSEYDPRLFVSITTVNIYYLIAKFCQCGQPTDSQGIHVRTIQKIAKRIPEWNIPTNQQKYTKVSPYFDRKKQ